MKDFEYDCLLLVQTLAAQPPIKEPSSFTDAMFNDFIDWANDVIEAERARPSQTTMIRPEGESQSIKKLDYYANEWPLLTKQKKPSG